MDGLPHDPGQSIYVCVCVYRDRQRVLVETDRDQKWFPQRYWISVVAPEVIQNARGCVKTN